MKQKTNNGKRIYAIIAVLVVLAMALSACATRPQTDLKAEDIFKHDNTQNSFFTSKNDKYKLEQTVVVSRHNIRSPLSGGDSLLGQITPHEWFSWTSDPSELSVKGGQLETNMGQFFRKYMEDRNLIPKNWRPEENAVRFYSNSMQRTISTARFFESGFLPVANIGVEYHKEYGGVDSIFCPIIRYNNPEFEKKVRAEINEAYGVKSLEEIGGKLKESYELLEKVLDFKDSKYAKDNNLTHIPLDDTKIELKVGNEVKLTGGLALANSAVDALKLQIYEEKDLDKALFGHKMTEDEIKKICEIGDVYQKICEGTKTLATQVMNPMVEEIEKELQTDERKFTFLCGHDSTLMALVCALGIKDYKLPNAISQKTPIGGKMMFEKYSGPDGKLYIKINMCYNSTDQLRECGISSLDNPPMFYELELEGLKKNEDGYYSYDDVTARFDEVISHSYDYYEEDVNEAA